jgi:hypothetical protein
MRISTEAFAWSSSSICHGRAIKMKAQSAFGSGRVSRENPPPGSLTPPVRRPTRIPPLGVSRGKRPPRCTRAAFMRRLRILSAALASEGCRSLAPSREILGTWTTFVSCPQATWQEFLGEPELVADYRPDSMDGAFQVWEHQCSDGRVKCVGHLFVQQRRGRWVVVARVCIA